VYSNEQSALSGKAAWAKGIQRGRLDHSCRDQLQQRMEVVPKYTPLGWNDLVIISSVLRLVGFCLWPQVLRLSPQAFSHPGRQADSSVLES
jgi:hypothetical protein